MAAQNWRPPKRLEHLEAVSGRNLLLAGPDPRTYFSVCLPAGSDDDQCCAVYRSEAVCSTLNPEWTTVNWPLQLASRTGPVVLAIHQVVGASCEPGHLLDAPKLWPEGGPICSLQPQQVQQPKQPQEESASSQAMEAGSGGDAAHDQAIGSHADGHPAPAGSQPVAGAAANAPIDEPAGAADTAMPAAAGNGEELQGFGTEPSPCTPAQQPEGQGAVEGAAEGALPPAVASAAEQDAVAQDSTAQQAAAPSWEAPTQPSHDAAAQAEPQLASPPGADLHGTSPSHASALVPGPIVAEFPSNAFPGEVVAAWVLDLDRLHPVGDDVAGLREELVGPNSIVLEMEDGFYLHPSLAPEAPAVPSLSAQSSPTKRGLLLASERLRVSSQGGSAPRRFATMLMSKLLRSAPNLQDTAEAEADSDSDSDAASEASSWSRFTTITAGAGGFTKHLSVSDLHLHITALVSMRASILELHGRALAVRERLEQLVGVRQQAQVQEQQVWQAQQDMQHSSQRAQQLQQRLTQLQQELAAASKAGTVRAQALVTTIKVMQAADRKLRDAQDSLQGEQGRGQLVGLHRELVARRCLMVGQLGRIFQLAPITVKVLEPPPGGYLEERLEQQWVGSGSGFGAAGSGQLLMGPSGPSGYDGQAPNGSTPVDTPRQHRWEYREEVHLSIGGIELRPAVWRAAFDDKGGTDITAAEDEAASVALGYVAQFVSRLSAYLDVPLRYPLCLLGSKSSILDGQPPAGTWSAEEPAKRTLFGRATDASGDKATAARPAEYPLYCISRRERPQFAIGVFLLNKDVIQLLQTHGISAGGPNHLLHNLYKLLMAAQSTLPRA